MSTAPLYRQDETQWAFQKGNKEIRIVTPRFPDRAADYQLARKVSEYLQSLPTIENFSTWDCPKGEALPPDVMRRWQIVDISKKYYKNLQKESLFYGREFVDVGVRVLELRPDSYLDSLGLFIKNWVPWFQDPSSSLPEISTPLPSDLPTLLLKDGVSQDPFTRMAAAVLQRDETPFISEHKAAGSYRFALEDGILKLEAASLPLSPPSKGRCHAALELYRSYLKRAFGWRAVESVADLKTYPATFDLSCGSAIEDQFFGYLKETFGIDFDQMIKEGKPLLPDHVYKCNIAANHIEMAYVETFFLRLTECLRERCRTESGDLSFADAQNFYCFLNKIGVDTLFSLREIQGIFKSFAKFSEKRTFSDFKEYLNSFSSRSIRHLPPQAFHQLMEILAADSGSGARENFFTGRKIEHLGICGYKTMGDKNIFDPCRNLAELLHIFPQLRSKSLERHRELLAFVVAKKALFSSYPTEDGKEWRVGSLIPSAEIQGITQWHYVDGYLNDGGGDVNYVLIPVCCSPNRDKNAPLIKLYRSTASDREADSSIDSLLADVNPEGVGSLDFHRGDEYERVYFERCTMPLWMGYLIRGDVEKAVKFFLEVLSKEKGRAGQAIGKEENLIDFLAWQRKSLKTDQERDAMEIYETFKQALGEERLGEFLSTPLGSEWAKKNKVSQDIHFVGHSLGGALSQASLYHFGPREKRIPLASCNFRCYAFDSPGGVTWEKGKQFLDFGREHKDLLLALGQKWGIHYQFEYQDFVPQCGASLLGISEDSEKDSDWLELTATLLEPLSTSKDKEIVSLPTHGRRFLHRPPGNDYKTTALSVHELFQFKSCYWLPSDLRKKFGYSFTTPRLTEELIRRPIGGTLGYSWFWLKKQWGLWTGDASTAQTDAFGVTFYSDQRRTLRRTDHLGGLPLGLSPSIQ